MIASTGKRRGAKSFRPSLDAGGVPGLCSLSTLTCLAGGGELPKVVGFPKPQKTAFAICATSRTAKLPESAEVFKSDARAVSLSPIEIMAAIVQTVIPRRVITANAARATYTAAAVPGMFWNDFDIQPP